ncbi:MAG: anti-CBASS protein Acb1 family protein, partial [Candidatus Adiutrix sp.]
VLSGGGAEDLDARTNYFVQKRNNDGLFVIDKESEDLIKLETPLGGVTNIVRQSLEFVAAINRTPAVKLLGISPSGFNATGDSDLRNYYDHVSAQQEKELRKGLGQALDVLQLNLLGRITTDLSFIFNPLCEEDHLNKAKIQKIYAEIEALRP